MPGTDSEGVFEGQQSAVCGEIGKSASCEFFLHLQTPLFNSDNNNNTHRPYFHSQAFNLLGCVGGVLVC